MGSRARIAAAACLMTSGLLVGGVGTAPAFAHPGSVTNDDSTDGRADQSARPHRPEGAGKRPVDRGEDGDPPAGPDDGDAEPGGKAPDDDAAGGDDVKDPAPEDDGEKPPGEVEDPVGDPPREGEEGGEEEETPPPPCCEKGDDDCGPGWPWPWPWPEDPVQPPPSDNNDSDKPPVSMPPTIPRAPIIGGPASPDVLDILPGFEIAASDVRTAPISVPVFVPTPVGVGPAVAPGIGPSVGPALGAGPGPAAGGSGAAPPAAPRQISTAPPPARQPLPASAGSSVSMPTSGSRVGYGEYLRSAGISQIAALALPGLAGILVLTGAGGLLGYRQAKAGQGVRGSGIARFMN